MKKRRREKDYLPGDGLAIEVGGYDFSRALGGKGKKKPEEKNN